MSITVNIIYKGEGDNALKFAREMEHSGVASRIRAEEGNLKYEYFVHLFDSSSVLLIDSWKDRSAIDKHHNSEMMKEIIRLREKYDLHMTVERFESIEDMSRDDEKYVRK